MNFQTSDLYHELIQKAQWSHNHGRNIFNISQSDINAARLFAYAYRSQAVGTFHATIAALRMLGQTGEPCSARAEILLAQLESKAGDLLPRDFRVLVSDLYLYDQWINQVVQLLKSALAGSENSELEKILANFVRNIQRVTTSDGIYLAQDLHLTEQNAFLVPNLGISILPLIYGDHHSWNAAFLSADQFGVPVHRHQKGAEIHLGFSPTRGYTILGPHSAAVSDGYAMPIPPMTDHGFHNTSGHDHILPFVFGSLLMTGWGVFFDVDARDDVQRDIRPLDSEQMNRSVLLDRAIEKISTTDVQTREVLIPADRAGSAEVGGLELAANVLPYGEHRIWSEHYRIISIRSGIGRVSINGSTVQVNPHDHFGVPAEMECQLTSFGGDPLIYLDAMILPLK